MNHNQALLTPPAETGVAPDGANPLADAYGLAEEMGHDPVNDMVLGPEDGMVRGADGQLHSIGVAPHQSRRFEGEATDVHAEAPASPALHEKTEFAPGTPTHQIPVRSLGGQATVLQVSVDRSAGSIYRSQSQPNSEAVKPYVGSHRAAD